MAFQIYQPGGGLVGMQQLELEKRKQDFVERQTKQQDRGFFGDVYDALKQGLELANQVTGIATNIEKIDALKQESALRLAEIGKISSESETAKRIASGDFGSALELQKMGLREASQEQIENPKLLNISEQLIPVKVGGKDTYAYKPLEAAQQVELAKKKMDLSIEEKKLASQQVEQAAKRSAEMADNTKDLRKEYNAHPKIKEFATIDQNYKQLVQSAKKEKPAGADDLKLVISFVKMLDPTSIVKESEITNVTNSSGAMDMAISLFNRVKGGGILDANIRNQILSAATDAYSSTLNQKQELDNWYASIAQKKGFDIAQVLPKASMMNLQINAPDLQSSAGINVITPAEAAPISFNPELFTSKRSAIVNKTVGPVRKKLGPGLLGGK